jgi:hypothetical protein
MEIASGQLILYRAEREALGQNGVRGITALVGQYRSAKGDHSILCRDIHFQSGRARVFRKGVSDVFGEIGVPGISCVGHTSFPLDYPQYRRKIRMHAVCQYGVLTAG